MEADSVSLTEIQNGSFHRSQSNSTFPRIKFNFQKNGKHVFVSVGFDWFKQVSFVNSKKKKITIIYIQRRVIRENMK